MADGEYLRMNGSSGASASSLIFRSLVGRSLARLFLRFVQITTHTRKCHLQFACRINFSFPDSAGTRRYVSVLFQDSVMQQVAPLRQPSHKDATGEMEETLIREDVQPLRFVRCGAERECARKSKFLNA